jgi:hypothetical protein
MRRLVCIVGLSLVAAAWTVGPVSAQQPPPKKAAASVKAGKGEKVCRVKLQYSGEVRTWVCKLDEPCCVWHEINYVKCGSPTFKCL